MKTAKPQRASIMLPTGHSVPSSRGRSLSHRGASRGASVPVLPPNTIQRSDFIPAVPAITIEVAEKISTINVESNESGGSSINSSHSEQKAVA